MAKMEQASAYCDQCEKQVLIQRPGGPNHILHLLMTIITGGIWLIIWFFVASESKPWRCNQCGKNLGGGSNGWGIAGGLLVKNPDNFEGNETVKYQKGGGSFRLKR